MVKIPPPPPPSTIKEYYTPILLGLRPIARRFPELGIPVVWPPRITPSTPSPEPRVAKYAILLFKLGLLRLFHL